MSDFSINSTSSFTYSPDGKLRVSQDISLTNITSKAYVTTYTVDITGFEPKNIVAKDNKELKVNSSMPSTGVTRLEISGFSLPAIGLGRTLHFSLSYDGAPAVHNGQVWQVFLPKLTNPDFYNHYQIKVIVPESWGHPVTAQKLTYSKAQLIDSGVALVFGNIHTYAFTGKYHLDSPGIITLPPDTPFQRISFTSISPPPHQVTVDSLHNWQANFPAGDITINGQVNIFSQALPYPHFSVPPSTTDYAIPFHSDHFTLGLPLPKSFDVSEATYQDFPETLPQTSFSTPGQFFPLISNRMNWTIHNPSGVALYDLPVTSTVSGFPQVISELPPYATQIYYVPLTNFFTRSLTISLSNSSVTYNIPATSYLLWESFVTFTVAISLTALGFFAHQAWSLYLQRHDRGHFVRR